MSTNNSRAEVSQPKIRDNLIFRQLDDEWVVYDSAQENLHVLNTTAAFVWIHCTGDFTIDEITDALCDSFENQIPRDQLERDVQQTIQQFVQKELVE